MFLTCGRFQLRLDRPLVMGILNVTPDSFADGGRYASIEAAIAQATRIRAEGADLIDIGGESTRPGASTVSPEEEIRRVMPVIDALLPWGLPLSIDTRRPEVMKAALAAGVDCINDVEALRAPGSMQLVRSLRCAICLMHMQGTPGTMQVAPQYRDVFAEVSDFLRQRVRAADALGIDRERLLVDPGIGFGKNLDHNLQLLGNLRGLVPGLPVLVGLSRKRMIGTITGREVDDRLAGSLGGAIAAVAGGAAIVRVHDVAATVDALAVWTAIRRTTPQESQ